MYSERKKLFFAVCVALCVVTAYCPADSEGDPTCEAADAKRYDGVGVQSIPRPAEPRRGRKPIAVFTTRQGDERPALRDGGAYDRYISLSNRPFTPARVSRLQETLINEGLRELKRTGRRSLREEYLEGVKTDMVRYREASNSMNKLRWGATPRPWRLQHDALDPELYARYDSEWDDIHLVKWGPLTVTDRGSIDVDTSIEGIQKLWTASLDDVEVAPDPPPEAPRSLLVGRTVRVSHSLKLRVSSSAFFKTFYQERPENWSNRILRSARYLRAEVGVDFLTDILKRRYLGADVEGRYYLDGEWMVLLHIDLLGR